MDISKEKKIAAAKEEVIRQFGDSVLSGKLLKNPPVRGPFGEAKITIMLGATPKRQRSFKMVGEREAALKEILEDYI